MDEQMMHDVAIAGAEQATENENSPPTPAEPQQEDIGALIAQAYLEDPLGTLRLLAQQAGYQLVPQMDTAAQQPSQSMNMGMPMGMHQMMMQQPSESQNPAMPGQQTMDPWQQLILGIATKMWQSEAAKQVEQLAQQDGIELTEQELAEIFTDALEKYAGDVEVAYAKRVLPKLRSKQNQPKQEQEKDVESAGDILAAIKQAGYR